MSRSRRFLLVSGLVIAVVVLYFGNRAWEQQKRLREVSAAYADFRACLYGEPLAANEKGSDRLRAIELCAPPKSEWPKTCAPALFRALTAFDALGKKEDDPIYGELRKHTRVGAEWKQELSLWLVGDPPSIDTLEASIASAPLPKLPAVSGQKKCTSKPRFSASDLVSLGTITNYRAVSEIVPGRPLRAIWASKESTLACWFAPDGDAVARCGARALANIASVVPADDAVRELYAWDFDIARELPYSLVSELAGETLMEHKSLREHGWARADGTIFVSTGEADGLYAIKGTEASKVNGPLPRNRTFLAVRPRWALWGEADADPQKTLAKGFRLDTETKEVVTLGPAPKKTLVRGCRTTDGELVVVMVNAVGDLIHEDRSTFQNVELRAFFPAGKTAFAPVVMHTAKLPWSSGLFDRADETTVFGCTRDGSPRWIWWQTNQVHDVTCTRSGCRSAKSEPILLGNVDLAKLVIAPIGDASVVVAYEGAYRGAVASLVHAVRVRIAKVADLARSPDTVLVADESFQGLSKLWAGLFAFGRGDVGWLAIRADNSLFALRFSEKSEFVPVRPGP